MFAVFNANLVNNFKITGTQVKGHQVLTVYLTLAPWGLSLLWWGPDPDFYSSLIETIPLGNGGKAHKPTQSIEAPSILLVAVATL